MAEAKLEADWSRSSVTTWMIYQANAGPKARKMTPDDFNPFSHRAKKSEAIPVTMRELKSVLKQVGGFRFGPATRNADTSVGQDAD